MPFIHRFLTPREERNLVYKTFSRAVKRQYPEQYDEMMKLVWKMPYEKLLRASLTAHHVNIYVDLAARKLTGVSQYDRYVKRVRRYSRVIGEIEDTVFSELPRTEDVLLDHLYMKVCELIPPEQAVEAMEVLRSGYVDCKSDIVDMLEQPLLLKRRIRSIHHRANGHASATNSLNDDEGDSDTINDVSSIAASEFSVTSSAILSNDFDELFARAAALEQQEQMTSEFDALSLEMVNETKLASSPQHAAAAVRDLMDFSSPGPRIQVVPTEDLANREPDSEDDLADDEELQIEVEAAAAAQSPRCRRSHSEPAIQTLSRRAHKRHPLSHVVGSGRGLEKLHQYLQHTGDTLPMQLDLSPECNIQLLLDAGDLEPDIEPDLTSRDELPVC